MIAACDPVQCRAIIWGDAMLRMAIASDSARLRTVVDANNIKTE
jgi:hypothetical protein